MSRYYVPDRFSLKSKNDDVCIPSTVRNYFTSIIDGLLELKFQTRTISN